MIPPAQHGYHPVENPSVAFWQQVEDEFSRFRTADFPGSSDIVIIGGGYAGAAAAWHLVKDRNPSQKNQKITLLEARGICSGATGRNGGHLRPELCGYAPKFIERSGVEAGVELASFEIAHATVLRDLIEKEKIDCDLVVTRSVDTWCDQEAVDTAAETYAKLVERGIPYMNDVSFKAGPEAEGCSGVRGAKAMLSYTAAFFWPYKFVRHILTSLVESGDLNLQTFTPVTKVSPQQHGGFTIQTPRGAISTKKVIYANNAYVVGLLPEYSNSIVPCKGMCCHITSTTQGLPLVVNSHIVRDSQRVSAYLIPRPDRSIIVGGANVLYKPNIQEWYNNVDDGTLIASARHYFDGYMQRTFCGWEDSDAKVDSIWTGVMGYSYDSHAHVGKVPGHQGPYVIAGWNGHGMPVVWLSGKGIAKMINEGVPFEQCGVPGLLKTTQERLQRAQNGREDEDI